MYPQQIENIATQHVQQLQIPRRPGISRRARVSRRSAGGIRFHAGWTLVAVGLRLASSAGR